MNITISIDCDKKTVNILDECMLERLRSENEKLAVDSVALDKIIKVVDGFDHNPDACMEDICEIIDGRGD